MTMPAVGWILELLGRRIWETRAEAFGEIAFTCSRRVRCRGSEANVEIFGAKNSC
jgi:hypothetical protein